VYLNLGAEPYLATLLAGKNSAVDLRGHGPVRIRQLQARIQTPLAPLHALSLGELAAMSWLAETWNQHDAADRSGSRVLALDFDALLAMSPAPCAASPIISSCRSIRAGSRTLRAARC
jgi:hypothetical protein